LVLVRKYDTPYEVLHVIVTNNAKRVVVVMKKNERMSFVHQYCNKHFVVEFEESFGDDHGDDTNFLKMYNVEQNFQGEKFAVPFLHNGLFRVKIFDYYKVIGQELNINEILGMRTMTLPLDNMNYPFIACTFVKSTRIFINFIVTTKNLHS
jgi:hypothetical protein